MTLTTGLVGFPVSHSLSPRIHAYWLAQHGIEADYKLFTTPPHRVRQTMHHMRKKNWRGVNVTVPHKQAVLEYLDSIDATATKIGAVNTITHTNGELIGTNTDTYGFITNLKEALGELAPHLKEIILLGAGGAARAAIVALQEAGATSITVINRSFDSAQAISREFAIMAAPWERRNSVIGNASLLVNTTSLGMTGHPTLEIDLSQLPAHTVVHDIVYAPLDTQLLVNARARGLRTVDGLGMLLYQAQLAFKQWHGILPDVTPELRTHVLEETQA